MLGDGAAAFTPGISERRGSTTTYAHHGLKNMEAQSQSGQTLTGTRQYDAFGNVTSGSGWQWPFGYAGGFGYQEDVTGLRLLGHRYYDSSTGRFLTRDPIKDGRNWYAYGESNPVSNSDEDGLFVRRLIRNSIKWVVDRLFPVPRPVPPKIHSDKQGKHIPGHKNFIPGRSELTHTNPQSLIDRFAGTGRKIVDGEGNPTNKEKVDFREVIGRVKDPKTDEWVDTTKGVIHYDSRGGAHIVPSL